MFVESINGKRMINLDRAHRVDITEKDGNAIISVSFGTGDRDYAVLGSYYDKTEARKALYRLREAMEDGRSVFIMPDSERRYEQERIRDARIKRKGGS